MSSPKWKDFLLYFKERFQETEVSSFAVAIAFYLLLSLFPLLLILGNIITIFHLEISAALPYLENFIPPSILETIRPIILDFLGSSSGGILSFGIIAAIWSAGRGFDYIQKGVNKAHGLKYTRTFIASRIISIIILILVIILFVASMLTISFGESLLLNFLIWAKWDLAVLTYFNALKWPALIILFCIALIIVYGTATHFKQRVRDVFWGAAFSTAGTLVLVQLFSYYLTYLSHSISMYGALSSFFVLMFWLNSICYIIMIGAVINATIYELRFGKPTAIESKAENFFKKKIQSFFSAIATHFTA